MSRSGYSDDCDYGELNLYRANVDRALAGKKGQAFLKEMLAGMDAMPVKELDSGELIRENGAVCALGVVAKARNLKPTFKMEEMDDMNGVYAVSKLLGIKTILAAEVMYENDEGGPYWRGGDETPDRRFERVRRWVVSRIRQDAP